MEDTAVFGAYTFPPELIKLHIGDLTSIVDKSEVSRRAVQKMLMDLGYYQDSLDGDFKEHTRAALRVGEATQPLQVVVPPRLLPFGVLIFPLTHLAHALTSTSTSALM